MKLKKTARKFAIGEFTDRYNQKCSIQKSSLATEDCIWLGVDDACPKIKIDDAIKVGMKPDTDSGWCPYPIPSEVLLSTRMHLTRTQVKKLLPLLQKFVKTGEL